MKNTKKRKSKNSFVIYRDREESDVFADQTIIATVLGGEGHRLRHYAVINSKDEQSFTSEQRNMVIRLFEEVSERLDSKIEEITFSKNYALIKLLVSMEVAIGQVLDESIIACNEKQAFVRFHYYCANVKKPTRQEIKEYLTELK